MKKSMKVKKSIWQIC